MKIDRPKSWTELQKCLFDYEIGLTAHGRFRSPFAYRGLSQNYPDLKTSLMRIGGPYKRLEQAILRNFQKYSDLQKINWDSEWLWLALAQHHGLPTRLLDWTYSPYVALHFATENTLKANHDGVIWCINYQKVRDFLPEELRKVMHDQGFKFTIDQLDKGISSLKLLDELDKKYGTFVIFLEPPSLDSRIINQYALFSLMSSSSGLLDVWLDKYNDHDDLFRKIIIPADLKWEIRDNLDQANINERMLFPGLDGLCSWLKRYYSAKDIIE